MKYRILKKSTWWTNLYDTGLPQFLYYDYDLEHFEIAGYKTVKNGKWTFTKEELFQLTKDYNIDDEFLIEHVREKGDKI